MLLNLIILASLGKRVIASLTVPGLWACLPRFTVRALRSSLHCTTRYCCRSNDDLATSYGKLLSLYIRATVRCVSFSLAQTPVNGTLDNAMYGPDTVDLLPRSRSKQLGPARPPGQRNQLALGDLWAGLAAGRALHSEALLRSRLFWLLIPEANVGHTVTSTIGRQCRRPCPLSFLGWRKRRLPAANYRPVDRC